MLCISLRVPLALRCSGHPVSTKMEQQRQVAAHQATSRAFPDMELIVVVPDVSVEPALTQHSVPKQRCLQSGVGSCAVDTLLAILTAQPGCCDRTLQGHGPAEGFKYLQMVAALAVCYKSSARMLQTTEQHGGHLHSCRGLVTAAAVSTGRCGLQRR